LASTSRWETADVSVLAARPVAEKTNVRIANGNAKRKRTTFMIRRPRPLFGAVI
jgi:hypothetical protein